MCVCVQFLAANHYTTTPYTTTKLYSNIRMQYMLCVRPTYKANKSILH